MLPYSDNMSFSQRWFNTILSVYDWALRRFVYIPSQEELTKQYFAHLSPLPSMNDLMNNISVIFVNTHRALSPPRPAMPGNFGVKFRFYFVYLNQFLETNAFI